MNDEFVAAYRKVRPKYNEFCGEVGRIIKNSFSEMNVKTHSIDTRAKSIESFAGKINKTNEDGRPKYEQPLREITDLAGVRIIVYTIDDIAVIVEFIDNNFNIIEKRDVGEERAEKGQFGYQSIHYLVKLTEARLALPDFSKFQDLTCEIQVRTVLQHAWAEMEHDIQYKGSNNIPKSVKRKFLSLAGLLEIADREFASIQREDESLKKNILSNLQRDLTRDEIVKSSDSVSAGEPEVIDLEPNGSGAQVRDLLAAGKISEAVEVYDNKIEREPNSYTLFIGRARAFFLLGETERALRDLDMAQELQPDNELIGNLRSKIVDGSLSAINDKAHNKEANLKVKEGDEALRNGIPEEAYICYSDAQSMGASWPFTTFKLALASTMAGDLIGATIHLDELKVNPGTPMEINITALRAILAALRKTEDFSSLLDQLSALKNEKGDFNLALSPLALLQEVDAAHFWKEQANDVTRVLGALS